ncbi:MAG: hypothetical protein QME58_05545 [Bacteroidota bacterium]|nr:hypothetical protein [Bacteroidota bacterium]
MKKILISILRNKTEILNNSIVIAYCFLLFIALYSCSHKTDFTNPSKVLERYLELKNSNNFDVQYDLISSKSREIVNKDEFVRFYGRDSAGLSKNIEVKSMVELEVDKNYPNYKRFKVEGMVISETDTGEVRYYYTLINEDNNWKVIWTRTLEDLSKRQYEKGLYNEAIKLSEKILEVDPFSSKAYSRKAWCFERDNSLPTSERNSKVLENAKKALALEPDIAQHYNTLAMYYGIVLIPELEIENLQKAVVYSLDEKGKSTYYSNIASTYSGWNKLDSAYLYINKAIALDSNSTFSWMRKGSILLKQNLRNDAQIAFERALNLPEMETALQSHLYFFYALLSNSQNKFKVAHMYILKALEMDPNNFTYQQLYKKIKSKLN